MTLYLVATPIGNLEDMSFRAVRVLGEVGVIAAEDTRTTGKLLKHYDIKTPLVSYHEHSDDGRIASILERLGTESVALVSDAGTPAISDPGYKLVTAAISAGHEVVPIPGACAVTAALIASGLPTDQFLFLGFMPKQVQARQSALEQVSSLPYTLVFYESPHRLLKFFGDVLVVLGDRRVSVGRELTKLYEEHWRGKVTDAMAHFDEVGVKGEVTVVVAGAEKAAVWQEDEIRAALRGRLEGGVSRRDAAGEIAEQSGWRKRDIYRLSLDQ